jgi:hypothetical protein
MVTCLKIKEKIYLSSARRRTLKKKEVCRTPGNGSVDFQRLPNVPKVPKKKDKKFDRTL